jgi:hypothetical protein
MNRTHDWESMGNWVATPGADTGIAVDPKADTIPPPQPTPQWAAQGKRLQGWLDSIGKTHQWLADILETSRAAVTQWVAGTQRPNLQRAGTMEALKTLYAADVPDVWDWQTAEEKDATVKYLQGFMLSLSP